MDHDDGFFDAWLRLLRRRWRTAVVTSFVVTAVGAAALLLARPVHRSEAALRLGEPPPPGGVSPAGGIFSFFQLGGDPFANDLELLASRSLAERVAERNALSVALDAPRGWHRDSLVVSLLADRTTLEASYDVRWEDDGRVVVRRVAPRDSTVAAGAPGAPLRFGGVTVAFQPWREGMPRRIGLSTRSHGEATRSLRGSLSVERPRREANIVSLAYDHTDPAVAQGVVASAVDEFVRLRTELQQRESGETVDSLRGVSARTAAELRRAEELLESLQEQDRIVAPEAQSEALIERQTELLSRLQRARAELAGIDESLRRLDAREDPGTAWTALLSHPAFMENETLGSLLSRITELHAEREALATRRTDANRELRVLDDQIAYLDASLRQVAREYRAGLLEQIASVEPELASLDAVLTALPSRALELGRRQRDVRLLSEVLIFTEQRLRQEELRDALTYANIQVIDPPALRERPVWPRKKLGLAVVLLVAGGCAMLGMVVRERTDPRLRSAADVEGLLGAPVLAVVAAADAGAFTGAEAEALLRRAGAGENGRRRLSLVDLGRSEGVAHVAARGLEAASGNGAGGGRFQAVGPLHRFADAAEAVSSDGPTALVVEVGRTTAAEVRRAARLVGEAGGRVVGAILVTSGSRDVERVWR